MRNRSLLLWMLLIFSSLRLSAQNGYKLWLDYQETDPEKIPISALYADESKISSIELQQAWTEMMGSPLAHTDALGDGTLILGTSADEVVQSLVNNDLENLISDEGYIIRSVTRDNQKMTVIASKSEAGLLYGVFHLLRLVQTEKSLMDLAITENPSYERRLLNHWDNLNGTVERGYSGYSIWQWDELPEVVSPRYQDYARANASVGINGTVLNNVNAAPAILSSEYLEKVKVIAGELRPYNVRVYLSINFSTPKELGGLENSDPLNPEVAQWWKEKAAEIFELIPDFGGFLVKANSEGLPGPMDYGRSHADGANMLADALAEYGGIVMWRAFVYSPEGDDRAREAYNEFKPHDGEFRENVIIQVKNGPIDFQPREPFSPLFGALEITPIMPELQITQEYLGFSNHLAFLSPMWEECLTSDTFCDGPGSTVARTTDGSVFDQKITAIAGVANIGLDSNWCGHHFAQANWYAYGRLAWKNTLGSDQIAEEWIRMTFSNQPEFLKPVKKMMLSSREAVVNYMMPLGLHHLFAWGHHYGPEPWCDVPGAREDWLPRYYHKASDDGLGFDRTTRGSNAVSQYHSPLKEMFNDPSLCPEKYLLWFHHLPWDYVMDNGRTLWDNLCYAYDSGTNEVKEYQKTWDRLSAYVNEERFSDVQSKLRIQARDAVWWKDACLLYFQQFSKKEIPFEIDRPVHDLDELMKIKLDMKHHN